MSFLTTSPYHLRTIGLQGSLCILATALFTPNTLAGQAAWELERHCSSARQRAMGQTGISVVDASLESTCYNPAALAQSSSLFNELVIASPLIQVGADSQNIIKDVKSKPKPEILVEKYTEKPQHASFENLSGVSFKRVAFSLYQKASADVYVGTDPVYGTPSAEARALALAGAMFTFSRGFFEQQDSGLYVGANIRFQQKSTGDLRLGIDDLETLKGSGKEELLKDSLRRGNGFGADLGVLWRSSGRTPVKLGLVARNLGMSYRWKLGTGKSAPAKEIQTVDAGFAIEPETKKSKMSLALDVWDLPNRSRTLIYNRLHMGTQIHFMNVLGVMGGINQGYPTYGAFLSLKFVSIEGGMTSEELGKLPGERQSKRYFARVKVGWLE